MKKVIRLTEADLACIVKRVIKEQAPTDVYNPSTMGPVSDEPRMYKPKSNEFDWKSHFDQIKNELDSYLNTIEGPVNVKRFQSKVRNAYYGMVSNVDDEYSYPSHGDDFIQLTDEYMSYFRNKLKNLVQKYGKLTESDLTNIIRRVIKEQQGEDKTQQCQKIKNRIAKNTRRGERLLKLFPKPFQPIMKKAFEEGKKNGPDAFFTALPNEIGNEVKNRFSKLKKPKTDAELEKIVVDMESKQSNIQEQQPAPIWFEYAILILGLLLIVSTIWNLSQPAQEYCGQSIWW